MLKQNKIWFSKKSAQLVQELKQVKLLWSQKPHYIQTTTFLCSLQPQNRLTTPVLLIILHSFIHLLKSVEPRETVQLEKTYIFIKANMYGVRVRAHMCACIQTHLCEVLLQ